MDEQRVEYGDETPFLSYDDMYKAAKRATSSHEQFWEQKTSTSDEEDEDVEPDKGVSPRNQTKKGFFATASSNNGRRTDRFSSLSMLPRLSSLRMSDLSERTFGFSVDSAPAPPAGQESSEGGAKSTGAEDREPKATRISSKLFPRWSNLRRRSQASADHS